MRWTLTCTLALLVLAPASALAGTPEDPEVEDPAGDAGIEGQALPSGGDDVDILAAWFTTDDTGTWAHLELASFDVHPEDVVFSVDADLSEERWIGVGYGSYLVPFPPFRTQGFQGCTGIEGQRPNCTKLPGRMLADRPGFAVHVPDEWIAGEPRLRSPTAHVAAYTMWPAVTFDEAGPGEDHLLEANGSEETNRNGIERSGGRAREATDRQKEREASGPGLAPTAIAAVGLALRASRLTRRGA